MRGPLCRSALAAFTVLVLLGVAAGGPEALPPPPSDVAAVEAAFGLGAAAAPAALPAGSADVTVEDDEAGVATAAPGEQEAEESGEARTGGRWVSVTGMRIGARGCGAELCCPDGGSACRDAAHGVNFRFGVLGTHGVVSRVSGWGCPGDGQHL